MSERLHPILGVITPDQVAVALDTGFSRFSGSFGIDGLASESGTQVDFLAVVSNQPGCGNFRRFIEACKENYTAINIWEVWNEDLEAALLRYGFRKEKRPDKFGDVCDVMEWRKQ